MKCTQ